jgi:hypothetical protein
MTNGVVSITVGGKMAMKVVAGIEGKNSAKVALLVRALGDVPTIEEMRKICKQANFGSPECLVIQTPTDLFYEGGGGVSPAYRAKFDDPKANPRFENRKPWDTENTIVIDFAKELQPDDVKISTYDKNQLKSLEIDSIYAIQENGSSTRQVIWNLEKAFQMGFTAVNRGEAVDGQAHPSTPGFVVSDEVEKGGELTPSGKRWHEIHAAAAAAATEQYYTEFPYHRPATQS